MDPLATGDGTTVFPPLSFHTLKLAFYLLKRLPGERVPDKRFFLKVIEHMTDTVKQCGHNQKRWPVELRS
jgi:hypothetical protein